MSCGQPDFATCSCALFCRGLGYRKENQTGTGRALRDYSPISPGEVNTKALPPEFRKSRFELVGIEGSFEGYTKGDHWNGWD